jgi:hypothetical protein
MGQPHYFPISFGGRSQSSTPRPRCATPSNSIRAMLPFLNSAIVPASPTVR